MKKRAAKRTYKKRTIRRRRMYSRRRSVESKHQTATATVQTLFSLMRTTTQLNATNWAPIIGWPVQGTTSFTRIGDQIKVKYGVLTLGICFGAQNIGCIYRIIVFSQPTYVVAFATSNIINFFRTTALTDNSIHGLVNTEVYNVFFDRCYALNTGGNQIGQTYPGAGADYHKYHRIVLRRPYKYPVKFVPGTTTLRSGFANLCVAVFCYQRGRPDESNLGSWTMGHRIVYYDD